MSEWRHLLVVDRETGERREFTVRISEEGIADWLEHRDELRASGKPDRPPDVDLPTLRAWVMHPGEEEHPYFVAHEIDSSPHAVPLEAEKWPVFTVSWRDERVAAQYRLMEVVNGSFELRVVFDDLETGARIFDVGRTFTEYDGDLADNELEELTGRLPDGMRLSVATVTDFEQAEAEMAEATADVARGFLLPPGPTVIQ